MCGVIIYLLKIRYSCAWGNGEQGGVCAAQLQLWELHTMIFLLNTRKTPRRDCTRCHLCTETLIEY